MRHTLRSLLRTPSVAAIAVLALGLAIGSATLVFSVTDAVLVEPLPYRRPDRLVLVWETQPQRGVHENVVSPRNFVHWREIARSFDGLAAVALTFRGALTGAGEPTELALQIVSPELFPLLGVSPALGRAFTPDENRPDAGVAILSHRVWTTRFGRDPGVVGRQIQFNGSPTTVVGVMPAGFSILDPEVDIWVPTFFDERARAASGRWLMVVGRLRDGVTLPQAQDDMKRTAGLLVEKFPDGNAGWSAQVVPMHAQVTGTIRPALMMLAGAVGFLLLIACANVTNLLLARGASRRRELAVRTALGARRAHLIRQQLGESLLLAAAGGALGWALAASGLAAVRVLAAGTSAIPRLDEVGLDLRVLAFACVAVFVAAGLAGLLPALDASRADAGEGLRDGGRGATTGRAARVRRALIVAEVALALILLTGAGLLTRSLVKLLNVHPGFDATHVLTARVGLSGDRYDTRESRTAFFERLTERLGSMPGVAAAGAVSVLPMAGLGAATSFTVVGQPAPPAGQEPVADIRIVSGGYFDAMAIPLLRGRRFQATDTGDSAYVIVVNETLVKQLFPDRDPLGRELRIAWEGDRPDRIVGVVGDTKHASLDAPIRPMIYFPHARSASSGLALTVRAAGDPEALGAAVVHEVRQLDDLLPVSDVRPMTAVIARTVAARRLVMTLLLGFSAIALALAASGLYAVMSYSVAERRAELAIRMALGAAPRGVLRLVVAQAMGTAAAGVAVGLAGALALARLMEALLYDTPAMDPVSFAGAALLLLAVGLAAAWLPGRAAAALDPLDALRAD